MQTAGYASAVGLSSNRAERFRHARIGFDSTADTITLRHTDAEPGRVLRDGIASGSVVEEKVFTKSRRFHVRNCIEGFSARRGECTCV